MSDRDAADDVNSLFLAVESEFLEAILAVVCFEQSNAARPPSHVEWDADSNRRARVSSQLQAEVGLEAWLSPVCQLEVDRRFLLEKWNSGELPQQLNHHLPFLYAKAFLYAADGVGRALARLAETKGVPGPAVAACNAYYDSFPSLREVRNSSQHLEDRARRLGRNGQPLRLQPVGAGGIRAPGGALVLSHLSGNRFGATMADGCFGEVEVSGRSLEQMRNHIETVLASFSWTGPPRLVPQ